MLTLSGCGTVAVVASVTGAAVGALATVAEVAVDGAVLVGKGVVKGGELAADALSSAPAGPVPGTP